MDAVTLEMYIMQVPEIIQDGICNTSHSLDTLLALPLRTVWHGMAWHGMLAMSLRMVRRHVCHAMPCHDTYATVWWTKPVPDRCSGMKFQLWKPTRLKVPDTLWAHR